MLKVEKVLGRNDVVVGTGVDGRTIRGRRNRYGLCGLRECCEKRLQGQIITRGPQMAKILKDTVQREPTHDGARDSDYQPTQPELGGGEAGYYNF